MRQILEQLALETRLVVDFLYFVNFGAGPVDELRDLYEARLP